VKVADFGYSTLATGEAGRVLLPKSRPWNAPEHHFGEFTVAEARKTDIYSFGMLCLWILFGSVGLAQTSEEFTFDASAGAFTSLEQLKDNDQLHRITNELIDSIPLVGLNAEIRISLKEFFHLTLSLNPEKRTSDVEKLVCLLCKER
jgi:serine/threonine protein kinase